HGGVPTVILKERYRDARNSGGFHVGKSLLENREAAHSDNGVDLPRLDERHNQSGAFGHEHRIAETLGFRLPILDGAQSARFTKEAEFIERRRAFVLDAETFWKQQQAAIERHGG